jgi:cytochrome c553
MRGAWTVGCLVGAVAWCLATDESLAAGDRALGEYLSSECVTCHLLSGKDQAGVPAIVGMPEKRIADALHEYKTKRRSNPVMQTVVGKFSGEEIAALAAYFGGLKVKN